MALCMKHTRPMKPLYPTTAQSKSPRTTPIARKSELHGMPMRAFMNAHNFSLGWLTITVDHQPDTYSP